MKNYKELDKQYILNNYKRQDLLIAKGKGSIAYDDNGKEYIDLASGIAVNSFGYCENEWVKAVCEQANLLQHSSNYFYNKPSIELAELLSIGTGCKKVFFSNSGAEANECAIKCARKYSIDKYGSSRFEIVSLNNCFHGRTYGALSATAQEKYQKPFNPIVEGFRYANANDIQSLKNAVNEKTAAVILETIQGEGGINVLDVDFVQETAKFLKEKDVLLIIDEVQTGIGRTGHLFSYFKYNIVPDIVTAAKGLAGGLPIGATMFFDKTENTIKPGDHGSTFGGNPICCAAAVSIVKRIDDAFLCNIKTLSKKMINYILTWKNIEEVAGEGYMLGIKCNKDPQEILKDALNSGLMIITAKDKIRIVPALNISEEALFKGLNILKEIIEK